MKTNFAELWAKRMEDRLTKDLVLSDICPMPTPTKWEKMRWKLRNALSYLTRYQIVDTWTMHDGCE